MTPTLAQKFHNAVRHGYFWCIACKQIVDRKDDGEPFQCCANCGSHRVTFMPAIIPNDDGEMK